MRRVGWLTVLMVAVAVVMVSTTAVTAGWVKEDDEFDMDSEISRRILAQTSTYLSIDMMKKGAVPCNRKGASYYNCKPGAEANQYSRPCSKIALCRNGKQDPR